MSSSSSSFYTREQLDQIYLTEREAQKEAYIENHLNKIVDAVLAQNLKGKKMYTRTAMIESMENVEILMKRLRERLVDFEITFHTNSNEGEENTTRRKKYILLTMTIEWTLQK